MLSSVPRRARAALLAGLALCLVPLATEARADAPPAAASPAVAAAETVTIQGSINIGDVQQAGRITRDGQTHGCEVPTPMPALDNADNRRRDAHTFQNPHPTTRCIVVEADLTGCAGNQTQVVAYSAFNPANPAAGVIGASGFSTINKMTFGFRVAAGAPYTVVVHETEVGTGCPLYKLKLTNAPLAAVTTEDTGANGFAIAPTVNDFRAALGPPEDRREISWDDVPESLADPQSLPADYYNTVQPRGLVFTSPADIRISSDGSGTTAPEFGDLGVNNQTRYQWFSFARLMSPVGANVADVAFRVAGTTTPAPTSAFGAVFASSDGASYLLPRDAAGDPLGIYVPPSQTNGLTFYGLRYPTPQVHSMSLAGDWATGVVNGTVFDNLIYADPGFRLAMTTSGPGRVTAPGLDCPTDCVARYGAQPVTLTAQRDALVGVRWSGACAGATGSTCVVTLSAAETTAAATFVSCATHKATVDKLKKVVKKRKAAVGKAKRALTQADRPAEVAEAKSALTKAHKKLNKAKKKLRKAKKALKTCLG